MISFPCSACGKRFDRADSSAGSLVWCTCGARNTVPWESTLPPAPEPPPTVPDTPAPAVHVPAWAAPRPVIRQRSKAYCFNHQDTPPQHNCAACGESFCADCVLTLEGRTLCGPCKNYALRARQRPPQVAVAAVIAPILALMAGPGILLLLFFVAGMAEASGGRGEPLIAGVVIAALLGVVLQLIALTLAATGLRQIETNPRLAGRALAITGLVAALVCSLLVSEIALLVYRGIDG